jgi:imidazolonepropionase-like amidohydrolase
MKSFIAELARRKTVVDPTLVVFEGMFTQDAGKVAPAYAPFVGTLPAAAERQFRSGGYPLPEGYTRADFSKSFDKLTELVGRLHKAGVPIVAGTDGSGIEIIRELELYVKAGLSPAEALATATIVPAKVVGIDNRTGSIAKGKEADLVLIDGDVSKDVGALRRVEMVMSDGVLMDGNALRKAAGFLARPK